MNKKVLEDSFCSCYRNGSGINVFNAQKSNVLSDIALANVEALARTEGEGLEWKGFAYNQKEQCCARALPSAICSSVYSACAE